MYTIPVKALRLNVATCTSRAVTSKVKSFKFNLKPMTMRRDLQRNERSLEGAGSEAFKTDDIPESTGG
jgi:hypothetical protein